MNKFVIIGLIAVAVSLSEQFNEDKLAFIQFQDFIKKYDRHYSSIQEYMDRFNVFKKNIQSLKPNSNYVKGITQFADMTPSEFRKTYLNLNISILNTIKFEKAEPIRLIDSPENFNWVDEGVVGAVKNQGSCGSCFAFSTVGNLEGLYAIKNNKSLIFSEQELVDCDTNDHGCNGGLMENAFQWIKNNGGLVLSENYPYKGKKGVCADKELEKVVKIRGFKKFLSQNEEDIKNYLIKTGPLAIALNANPLQFYESGILDLNSSECHPRGLNHAVVLVGYGVENNVDYWIVRNSWGGGWGEDGYFRIIRGKGTCGINSYIITGILE